MARSTWGLIFAAGVAGTIAVATAPRMDAAGAAEIKAEAKKAGRIHARERRVRRGFRPGHGPYIAIDPNLYRGFYDPGYAYHGNINGCVIDQGYGRYAPCSVGY